MLSIRDQFTCSLHKKIYTKHLEIYKQRKKYRVGDLENDLSMYKLEEVYYKTVYGYRNLNDIECLIEDILPAYNYVHDEELEDEHLISNSSLFDNHPQKPIIDKTYLVEIDAWFPIFCGGICRLVYRMPSGSKFKTMITGAILDFNSTDFVVSTHENRYIINENICNEFIGKYVAVLENLPSLKISSNYWIRDIVNISRSLSFRFRERFPTTKMSLKAVEQHLIEALSVTKTQKIFDTCKKRISTNDQVPLRRELDNILLSCHIGENWAKSFKSLLQKCGQSSSVIALVDQAESTFVSKISEDSSVYLDRVTIGTYEEFKVGNIINSTFDAETRDMVLWAVMKISRTESFYIRGLVRLQSARNRLCFIEPEIIISVSKNGRSVNTPGHIYELIGPMYTLSVIACYPSSQNIKFLEVFQSYFSAGIPRNWKCIVSVMHILCQCPALEFTGTAGSATVILDSNKGSSYVPSFTPHDSLKENCSSFKIPGSVVSRGHTQTYRKSIDNFRSHKILEAIESNTSISKMTQPDTNEHETVHEQSCILVPNGTCDNVCTSITATNGGHILSGICESNSHNPLVDIDLHQGQSSTLSAKQTKEEQILSASDKPIAMDIFVDLANSYSSDKESSRKCISVTKENAAVLFSTKKRKNPKKIITFQGFLKTKNQKRVISTIEKETHLSKKPCLIKESPNLKIIPPITKSQPLEMKPKEKSVVTRKKPHVTKTSIQMSPSTTTMNKCVIKKSTTMDMPMVLSSKTNCANKLIYFDSIEERTCMSNNVKTDLSTKKLMIRKVLDKPATISPNKEYHMVIGRQDVNLSQIAVTRSGRVSLPPRDYLRQIMFEQHGDIVELKKDNKVIAEWSLCS